MAGVSSFGFSGTNAHVIVAEPPPIPLTPAKSKHPMHFLRLSAKSDETLRELAKRFADHLTFHPAESWADLCFTANSGRAEFAHRLALAAASSAQARMELAAFAAGENARHLRTGHVTDQRRKIAFVFSGDARELTGIGRRLYDTQLAFNRTMERCAELAHGWLHCNFLEALYPDTGARPGPDPFTDDPAMANAALFALQYALTQIWRSWGIGPAAVMGQGVGEYVAASIAGVLRWEDALRLAIDYGRLQGRTSAAERSACLTEAEAAAFHYGSPRVPFVSAATGMVVGDSELTDPRYWRSHLRWPAQTMKVFTQLPEAGCRLLVEIGPGAIFAADPQSAVEDGRAIWVASLRRGRDDWEQMFESLSELYVSGVNVDWGDFARDFAGQRVDAPTYPFRRQRCWIEIAESARRAFYSPRRDDAALHPLLGHCTRSPMIEETIFECRATIDALPYLIDHRVHEKIVLPMTAYLEMAIAAANVAHGAAGHRLEDVEISEALVLSDGASRTIQLVLAAPEAGRARFHILSRPAVESGADDSWTAHVAGNVRLGQPVDILRTEAPQGSGPAGRSAGCTKELTVETLYQRLEAQGSVFGAAFRGVQRVWRGETEAYGQVRLPDSLAIEADRYTVHPACLDACLHILAAIWPEQAADSEPATYMPIAVKAYQVHGCPGLELTSHVVLSGHTTNAETLTYDAYIFDVTGRLVIEVRGLTVKRVTRRSLRCAVQEPFHDWLYEVGWIAQPAVGDSQPRDLSAAKSEIAKMVSPRFEGVGAFDADLAIRAYATGSQSWSDPATSHREHGNWLIFEDRGDVSRNMVRALEDRGENCILVSAGDAFEAHDTRRFTIDPTSARDHDRVIQEVLTSLRGGLRGVVHLWSVDQPDLYEPIVDLNTVFNTGCRSALHLVQAVGALGADAAPRVAGDPQRSTVR